MTPGMRDLTADHKMYTIDHKMYTGLESIFSSKARTEILALFLINPKDKYYVREICKATGLPLQSAQRELKNLESFGLLERKAEGNRVFYEIKTGFFLYPELKNIILKTTGLGDILRSSLQDQRDIKAAFIYGSYAKDTQNTLSDIDLFVVGSIASRKLHAIINKTQKELTREIRFVNFSPLEFKKRKKARDHFVTSVLKGPKIFIIGDENVLQKIS